MLFISWFLNLLNETIYQILIGLLDMFGKLINNIFQAVYDINAKIDFSSVTSYVMGLAIAFVGLCAVKQGLDIYVFQVDGDPDSDPLELVTRTFIAVAVIYCGDYVLKESIKFAGMLCSEIQGKTGSITAKGEFDTLFKQMLENGYGGSFYKTKGMGFAIVILCCMTLIATLIFSFQAVKRGAELMLFQLMLPLIATDLITTNKERWNAFKSELVLCVFGYILQVLSFNVFLYLLAKGVNEPTGLSIVAAMGWLIVVISTPKWLSKFMYSSGAGNGAKGGVRTAAFMLPQMMK